MAKSAGGDKHPQASKAGMAIIRIFLGALFLFQSITQIIDRQEFMAFLKDGTSAKGILLTSAAWEGYGAFLAKTVHTHVDAFAWIIILGGLLAGVLLLFGVLTRLAALIALFVSAFYLCGLWAQPMRSMTEIPPLFFYAALMVMELAVLIAAAGRTFGFDALIAKRMKVKLLC